MVKLGLLVCPPASIHRTENILDDRLAHSFHRLHLHLAGGSNFQSHDQVKAAQLYLAFCGWLDDTSPRVLQRDDVVRRTEQWPERIQVALALQLDSSEIDRVRSHREAAVEPFQAIVDESRSERGRSFAQRWDEQLASFGPGHLPLSLVDATGSLLRGALADRDVPVSEWRARLDGFFHGEAPKGVLVARLACGLFAALGWLAERHQAGQVDRGMLTDFRAIATYAPYCDAMFVDRQGRRLLIETPLRGAIPANLEVFDIRRRESLKAWLDNIEAAAPDGHVELVKRVYGEDWLEPFSMMFDVQS